MISRLGPGRSKHISTRLLWSQQALRKLWFKVGRISTKKNVAGLEYQDVITEEETDLTTSMWMQR